MNTQTDKATLQSIALHKFVPGKYQPRHAFDEVAISELASSIKQNGLIQPIVARPLDHDKYEIIAGERRWRAAQKAGLSHIDCLVNNYTDEQAAGASAIENLNRMDLNPIEEAKAYQRLIDEFGYRHDEVAATLGKSRTKITNSLRLLKIVDKIQKSIIDGQLTEGHGKALAALPIQYQLELGHKCIKHQWSVRKLEKIIKTLQQSSPTPSHNLQDPNITALTNKLSEYLGCPVFLQYHKGKGKLVLNFHDDEILEGIFERMHFQFED